MLQKTRGIVLRAVKYGETSVVATVFTEELGVQSYLVNGVRSAGSARMKAAAFQPGMILEMVVYHHARKSLQRISEIQYGYLYQKVLAEPVRAAIMLYMAELLLRVLQLPQPFRDLYDFTEKQLKWLDTTQGRVANMPLYFTLHLAAGMGIGLPPTFHADRPYLDLREGVYLAHIPSHPDFLDAAESEVTARLLACSSADEAAAIALTQPQRRKLILHYQDYLRWHVPDFTSLHALPVLFQLFDTTDS
ncbi:DNA replication and repair protein RecO [Thermoflavifilum aggregans]|uniref:DNA repair protein RecO n=1 Tax=Thermoflavifilum aggregans TaxID=454188 RepID=A0A2M9CRN9_9BACT|nr:DNA repair protein RecO [Thermoflavifilum aggregans]PJJ74505.1 DNA replication and repair protein RecO [Thermoflavifilum aggregans]